MNIVKTMFVISLILLITTCQALSLDLTIGGYGGVIIPSLSYDIKNGSLVGINFRTPLKVPYYISIGAELKTFGDPEITVRDIRMNTDGGQELSLNFGFPIVKSNINKDFNLIINILDFSIYKWERKGYVDITGHSYNTGIEANIKLKNKLYLNMMFKIFGFLTSDSMGRQNFTINLGINYDIFRNQH